MDYQEICGHEGLEKKWQTELAMQGRDYAVAIRTARMMQKLGLVDVDLRMNDRVEFITTQYADYEETKNDFIADNDWTSGIRDGQKGKADSPFINPWFIPQRSRRLLRSKF